MARPELGTKRVCPVTGRKFYDMNKDPIISPYTGQIVTIAAPIGRSVRTEAVVPGASDGEADAEVLPDVELVSLEEADEAAPSSAAVVEDDIEVEDEGGDDDTFLEEDEDEDEDVTDLIGDGIEDDDETL